MRKHRDLILTTLICLLPMAAAALLYDRLPEQMVTHWGNDGPDGYSSKVFACFGLPMILTGFHLVLYFIAENDPKRKNASAVLRRLTKYLIPAMSVVTMTITLAVGLGKEIDVDMVMPVVIGIMFLVIGNYLPKCKQNYTMGIKCPWTLNSEENWNKTHHLGGYLYIIEGILMIFGSFGGVMQIVAIGGMLVAAIFPFAYSFWLYKKGI